ncbi:transglycosylase SLT domain-containing protein [Streptomyces sp. NPDC046900]|uniref:transglycosylase SLT domain-containing protein n=1 Tax=Streptomyces sp. NPDC046900 TaxID=3155473 RepID=UPI003409FD6A
MPQITNIRSRARALTKTQKLSAACCAGLGIATLAITATPSEAQTTTHEAPAAAAAPVTIGNQPVKAIKASITDQEAASMLKAEAIAAKQKAAQKPAAQKAQQQAVQQRSTEQPASRSADRAPVRQSSPKSYANNLDGWIRQSLDIMAQKGIPGSYNGLYRNIMRESSGNPMAINNWDINARNGIPSKGLLQVIDPTFRAYHVAGTSMNIYDPVANITAACNYAAHRYGSMDNVNSAY